MHSATDTKTINKNILQLALPMAGTQLITMGSGFLCMTMLATLGHEVLAASALIFSISISLVVSGFSFLFSLCILVGHAYGAKDYLAIGGLVQQSWALALLLSIPIMLIFWYIYPLLIFFGQNVAIAKIVEEFMHANIWRVVPLYLAVCNQQLCYGVHKQKIDLIANILGVIVLLLSAYMLIFGKFGCPALGAAGLGYAISLQALFYFLFTTSCLVFMKDFKSFKLFQFRFHQHWNDLARLFKIGWPISVQISGEMLSFTVCSIFIGWLSTNALAAAQIIFQYEFLIVVPYFALSQAGGILIGQAFGSKQFSDIKNIGYSCLHVAIVISILVGVLFISFPKPFTSLYLNINNPVNAPIVYLASILFIVLALSQILDAIRHVLIGILRGLFDSRYPMFVSLASIWLFGIPLSYLLAFPLQWGVVGIMIGSTIGMLIGMIILLFRWRKLSEKF